MALDYNTALSEYGAVATFAQNNADVNGILQQAIQGEWDAARFERALWGTNWYKSLSDNQRQLQVQQATDPASYNLAQGDKAKDIYLQAQGLGKNISLADAASIANQAIWYGWSQQQITDIVGGNNYGDQLINGRMTGQAGDTENHIRSTFAAYGVPVTDAYVTDQVNRVLAGWQTVGGVDNQAVAQASKLYPQYAQDFTEGRTLSNIAQPFIQKMADTLELDPSAINVNDNTIMKALQGDGTNPTSIWQFQQQLKADPRWGKTDNAKNAAYNTLAQIGKDWGFM